MEPDPSVEDLVFEYLEQVEEAPERASHLLEDLCAAHPSNAQVLRRRIGVLRDCGLWEEPVSPLPVPAVLGDFELLRVLGTGGMGVVHLAEQKSVGRRVALKLIRSEQLHQSGARARFLREVQAVARLDHPGIVRVLTAGQDQGIPYLAMEYVVGASLERLLKELRGERPEALQATDARAALSRQLVLDGSSDVIDWSPSEWSGAWLPMALRIVRDVAFAVHHAHQRGVLHRDLKPANILLTPSGKARLLDFGLASLAGDHSLTQSGTRLGSLPFMSPEQVNGQQDRIGPVSDVYSLGVVLYELLTLQLPYHGATHEALCRAILDARAVPARRSNPSVSVDVEIVCAKAMDRDPERRYATAAEFAEDLEAILSFRPIKARAPSVFHRAVRFMQRRPATTLGLLLGSLLLIAGPVGWELQRTRSLHSIQAANDRAERDFRAALAAIGHVLRDMAWEDLEDVPRMQVARLKAIDRARELFPALTAERPDDIDVLSEWAELCRSRGDVLQDLGRIEEATAEFENALAAQRRAPLADGSAERRWSLASTLNYLGKARSTLRDYSLALAAYDECIQGLREMWNENPAPLELGRSQVTALANRSQAHFQMSNIEACRADLDEALTLARTLTSLDPSQPWLQWSLGRVHGDLADLEAEHATLAAAISSEQRSLDCFLRACELAPQSRFFRYDVTTAHFTQAKLLQQLGNSGAADRHLDQASAILEELLRDYPDAFRMLERQAQILGTRGVALGRRDLHAEACEFLEPALAIWERLAVEHPERADLAGQMAQAMVNSAMSLVRRDRGDDRERALELLDQATEKLDLCREHARLEQYDQLECALLYIRGLDLFYLDQPEDALQAREELESLVPTDYAWGLRMISDLYTEQLRWICEHEADSEERRSAEAQATDRMFEFLERAVEAGYQDGRELDTTPELAPFRDDPRMLALLARIRAAAG